VKLLLDANLSYRLVKKLQPVYTECLHVSQTGLPVPAKDIDIWNWAKQNDYAFVVSNDEDFLYLLQRFGSPPKLVLLRTGNQSTQMVADILLNAVKDLEVLMESDELEILEILRQ